MDPDTWAFVLAATLGAAKSAWLPTANNRGIVRWPGLTLESLYEAITRCDLGDFTDDELETKIAAVEQWQAKCGVHLISMRRLGEMLNLTAAEREVCRIRTIDAVDETRDERKARLAKAQKAADREAKRAKRGRVAREVYEGSSLSKTKPWEAEGISRATWYRRKRETGVSAHHIYPSLHERTHLSHDANQQVADPASTDRQTPSGGAGAAPPRLLPGSGMDGEAMAILKNEEELQPVQLHGGDLGTEASIVQRHPVLAHLSDPSHAPDSQAILWQWEHELFRLSPFSHLEISA
jgi:hypothetical protein